MKLKKLYVIIWEKALESYLVQEEMKLAIAEKGGVPIEQVYQEICLFAREMNVRKVVLFGSRARGDNKPKSDIDLAVYGCPKFYEFKIRLDEELWSLLQVDAIDMDSGYVSKDLIDQIERDGVILYEKI